MDINTHPDSERAINSDDSLGPDNTMVLGGSTGYTVVYNPSVSLTFKFQPQELAQTSGICITLSGNRSHRYYNRLPQQHRGLRPICGPWQTNRPGHHFVPGWQSSYSHIPYYIRLSSSTSLSRQLTLLPLCLPFLHPALVPILTATLKVLVTWLGMVDFYLPMPKRQEEGLWLSSSHKPGPDLTANS